MTQEIPVPVGSLPLNTETILGLGLWVLGGTIRGVEESEEGILD